MRIAALEANLKRQMLDKGLSPGEIQQVLHASQLAGMDGDVVFTGQADADKAALVKLMTEYSYSGGDIARVLMRLRLARANPQPSDRGRLRQGHPGHGRAREARRGNRRDAPCLRRPGVQLASGRDSDISKLKLRHPASDSTP